MPRLYKQRGAPRASPSSTWALSTARLVVRGVKSGPPKLACTGHRLMQSLPRRLRSTPLLSPPPCRRPVHKPVRPTRFTPLDWVRQILVDSFIARSSSFKSARLSTVVATANECFCIKISCSVRVRSSIGPSTQSTRPYDRAAEAELPPRVSGLS
jgi:hypothetical protein